MNDRWISVKERLPKLNEIVVAWLCDINEPCCVKLIKDDEGFLWVELVSIPIEDASRGSRISHWMSLPPPPKE